MIPMESELPVLLKNARTPIYQIPMLRILAEELLQHSFSVDQIPFRRYGHHPTTRSMTMSKAFLAATLQDSLECTGVAANQAAADLIEAIVREMKKEGGFTLPSFGTFTVKKTKARKALNPRTGEPVKVKAGKTVRFKASPNLKKAV